MNKNFFFTIFLIGWLSQTVIADSISLDGSLGTLEELKGPDFVIDARLGAQVGNNLFHSFQNFNLNVQESATFRGPATIERVINRVTGGQLSHIDGLLKSEMPLADMYFLNPAGVVFGKNAQLSIPGALHISTADYLKLGENGRFDVQHPEQSSLTIAAPSEYGFLGDNIAPIEINGSFLQITTPRAIQQLAQGETVTQGNALTFVGGNFKLNGYTTVDSEGQTEQGGTLLAFGGQIHIASIASSGEVPTDLSTIPTKRGTVTITHTTTGKLTTTHPDTGEPLEIDPNLTRMGNLDTTGLGGGKIEIHAQQVMLDNAYVFADTLGNQNGQGVDMQVTEEIALRNGSRITAAAFEDNFPGESTGDAGSIHLNTHQLTLTEGSQISTSTRTPGSAGKIAVTTDQLSIAGHTEIAGLGSVNSAILSNTIAAGHGGEMTITAQEVNLDNQGEIRLETSGLADGGNLSLETQRLNLRQGGQLNVSTGQRTVTQGSGAAGNMTITAHESITIEGTAGAERPSGLLSNTFNQGQGGTITLSSPRLAVQNQGVIQAGTQHQGKAGKITLQVDNLAVTSEGAIETTTLGSGEAGDIEIQAHETIVQDKGVIRAGTQHEGQAGKIIMNVDNLAVTNEGSIETTTFGSGNAGDITIHANQTIDLSQSSSLKAAISSQSDGTGNAGTIGITTEYLQMNQASITTRALAARGGNVVLNIGQFAHLVDSEMTVRAMGENLEDEGGNIVATARSPLFFILHRSLLDASGIGGNAGNIRIAAENFIKSADSFLNVTSKLGIDGRVEIISPNEEVSDNLVVLPSTLGDATELLKQCNLSFYEKPSHFIFIPDYWGRPKSVGDWQ